MSDQVSEEDVEATDAARNLAEENNVDLTSVKGTGVDGKITVEDVREAIELIEENEAVEGEPVEEEAEAPTGDPALSEDPAAAIAEAAKGGPTDAEARAENDAQGDVEVMTIPEATVDGEEFWAPISVEDWVILGNTAEVPPRVQGRKATVVDAPRDPILVGSEAEVFLTVRVRDETNALLTVPLSAVTVDRGGRSSTR
jgi:2-oxoacid dehydrogenase-like protein with E3 subunit-binding domain